MRKKRDNSYADKKNKTKLLEFLKHHEPKVYGIIKQAAKNDKGSR